MIALSTPHTQVPLWRKIVAGVLGLGAAFALATIASSEVHIVLLPIVLLAVAALAIHLRQLGPQLFARAAWWSNLALGTALAVSGGGRERDAGFLMTIGCAGALLVAGRKGLAEASESAGYAPPAFRSSLLLLMVFVLADLQTFLLIGILYLNEHHSNSASTAPAMLAFGAVYAVGFAGLYRLRIWGAIVSVAASALAIGVLGLEIISMTSAPKVLLVLVALGQCLVGGPMLIAIARKTTLPALPRRVRALGSYAVICGLVAVSAYAYSWSHHW